MGHVVAVPQRELWHWHVDLKIVHDTGSSSQREFCGVKKSKDGVIISSLAHMIHILAMRVMMLWGFFFLARDALVAVFFIFSDVPRRFWNGEGMGHGSLVGNFPPLREA